MVLLPGCVCCGGGSCGFPYLAAYSVEVNGYTSWAFRCGRPAGTSASGPPNSVWTPSSSIRNSQTQQCDAVGGYYGVIGSSSLQQGYELGGGTLILQSEFQSSSTSQTTISPLGARFGGAGLGVGTQLSINQTTDSGLVSWTFRASCSGQSGRRWRNITSFYSQTTEDKKCVSDTSLSCCGGPDFFHLPTPTTFSFSQDGVTVDFGGASQVYSWTSGVVNSGQGYTNFLASDFDGTPNVVIQKYTACFANCDYSTNLCCNPLP
jgi:hypothetical protein